MRKMKPKSKMPAAKKTPMSSKAKPASGVPKLDDDAQYLMGSRHFRDETPAKPNPKQRMYNENDGLPAAAKQMGKRFIGGRG